MSEKRSVFVALEGALLSVPKAYLKIGQKGDVIVVPISVISNLYHFSGAKKAFASDVCDYLSQITLDEEFKQENGTFIRVINPDSVIDSDFRATGCILSENKQKNLQLCLKLSAMYDDSDVILLSQNPVLLLQASGLGIKTQIVDDQIFPLVKDRYTGLSNLHLSFEDFGEFTNVGKIRSPRVFHENEFVLLYSPEGGTTISRYTNGFLDSLHFQLATGFKPLNLEQILMTEALYAPPSIAPLVIVSGAAGTGKTYTAASVARDLLGNPDKNKTSYDKIIISTPAITDIGESLGYLPGDITEKTSPYFGGLFDAFMKIFINDNMKDKMVCYRDAYDKAQKILSGYLMFHQLELMPLGFLAGHSFENSFIIVDEAQNIDPNFFLNIVSRVSTNSKLVILGDPYQVKAPGLSRNINGIIYMMELWKNESLAWQIQMNTHHSVRSELCQRAIELMS